MAEPASDQGPRVHRLAELGPHDRCADLCSRPVSRQNPLHPDSDLRQIPLYSHLGKRLRDSRRLARLSQGALAARIGVSVPTVRQAERGQGALATFQRILLELGLDIAGGSLPPGENLGDRLRILRRRLGMSQRDVAARAACSATTVAAIERGRPGHLAVVEAVGEVLGARLTLVGRGRAATFVGTAATSSSSHEWATPTEFLDRLRVAIGHRFDLDPCSPGKTRSRVPARVHYTELDDGLTLPWHGTVFMNPPYGRGLPRWTQKARAEVEAARATTVIGLVPARTDTSWWHRDIVGHADVWLLRGRVKFGDGSQGAPFPSALLLWGGNSLLARRITNAFPDAHWLMRTRPTSEGITGIAAE